METIFWKATSISSIRHHPKAACNFYYTLLLVPVTTTSLSHPASRRLCQNGKYHEDQNGCHGVLWIVQFFSVRDCGVLSQLHVMPKTAWLPLLLKWV
jgi:hypothetical protein